MSQMAKVRKGNSKMKKFILFVLYVILFMAFWNLFDFLFAKFITDSKYHFTTGMDLFIPVFIAVFTGYGMFLRKKK